jgi:hypothetical protein
MEKTLSRLAGAGIEAAPLPGVEGYVLCARGAYGALVTFGPDGFGRAGSSGLITERGLAVLVWRGESAVFVTKGEERTAGDSQVEELRAFMADLESTLARSA